MDVEKEEAARSRDAWHEPKCGVPVVLVDDEHMAFLLEAERIAMNMKAMAAAAAPAPAAAPADLPAAAAQPQQGTLLGFFSKPPAPEA